MSLLPPDYLEVGIDSKSAPLTRLVHDPFVARSAMRALPAGMIRLAPCIASHVAGRQALGRRRACGSMSTLNLPSVRRTAPATTICGSESAHAPRS